MSLFGGIAGIVQTAGSLFDNAKARREQKNAREYNYGMWQEENAYNDPSAQMERLRNAGLNPNLVYGNGATTLAARSTPAQAIGDHGLASALEKGIQAFRAYQDIKQTDAQTDHIKADTRELQRAGALDADNKSQQFNILTKQNDLLKHQIEASAIHNRVLKMSLPSIMETLQHKEGSWYQYWRNVGEMVHAFSPFANTVGDYVGMSDRK